MAQTSGRDTVRPPRFPFITRWAESMLTEYRQQVAERAAMGLVPKPLTAEQTVALVELFRNPPAGETEFLLDLLANRVPAGVDDAAYVKAGFLAAIARGQATSPILDAVRATELLGTMLGGYNVAPLIELLDDAALGSVAAKALANTLLVFDAFHDVQEKAEAGHAQARAVMQSWADADWFTSRAPVPEKLTVTVFKVPGEINTDDLSPATDAWSRPDIPLHAKSMLKNPRDGVVDAERQIKELKAEGHPVAFVGDVVGTGSSRKSATNSLLWFTGDDIPYVPNKRAGGVCIGGKIAPIFFNTMEDSGALPIECDVTGLTTGDVIDIYPYLGQIKRHDTDELVTEFALKTEILLDEVRAGGRIPLIIGRGLTDRARKALGLEASAVFRRPVPGGDSGHGYTLAACPVSGPGPIASRT